MYERVVQVYERVVEFYGRIVEFYGRIVEFYGRIVEFYECRVIRQEFTKKNLTELYNKSIIERKVVSTN
jgi:hypothetical protein